MQKFVLVVLLSVLAGSLARPAAQQDSNVSCELAFVTKLQDYNWGFKKASKYFIWRSCLALIASLESSVLTGSREIESSKFQVRQKTIKPPLKFPLKLFHLIAATVGAVGAPFNEEIVVQSSLNIRPKPINREKRQFGGGGWENWLRKWSRRFIPSSNLINLMSACCAPSFNSHLIFDPFRYQTQPLTQEYFVAQPTGEENKRKSDSGLLERHSRVGLLRCETLLHDALEHWTCVKAARDKKSWKAFHCRLSSVVKILTLKTGNSLVWRE